MMNTFMSVDDVAKELGISKSYAYKIVHRLNAELKEKGYIPTNASTHIIKSATVSIKAGKYYVSVLVEESETE